MAILLIVLAAGYVALSISAVTTIAKVDGQLAALLGRELHISAKVERTFVQSASRRFKRYCTMALFGWLMGLLFLIPGAVAFLYQQIVRDIIDEPVNAVTHEEECTLLRFVDTLEEAA